MKQFFTSCLFLFVLVSLKGQQATQYSLYTYNPYAFNPAYAGFDESLSITGVYRNQWVGFNGSPESQNVSAHMPFYFLGGGIGINVNNDVIGAHRSTQATISYSKYLKVGDGQLGIGLSGGFAQQAFTGNILRTPDGDYDEDLGLVISHNDIYLSENNIDAIAPVVGIGLFYKKDALQIGLSSNNIIEPSFEYQLDTRTNILLKRDYFLFASYDLDLSSDIMLTPSLLVKSDAVETQTDISMIMTYKEIIRVGGSFRGFNPNNFDSVIIMAGIQLNRNVRFAYAYDIALSALQLYNSGSHEIILQYNLNKKVGAGIPPPIIYNPRSL